MKREEINVRDPFILKSNGKYYLYGTRSATTWSAADGFDCYESSNLSEWDGPFEIYHKPKGSIFDRCYWAPECYEYQGRYYLVTTLGTETGRKGVYALVSDSPKGPFTMHSRESLTPEKWLCIDGTLYFAENGKIFLVFSHSFEDIRDGEVCAVELKSNLAEATGDPFTLFRASDAGWSVPIPFAEQEFGVKGDVFFSDGPCVYRMADGKLSILWSSWSKDGYAVGQTVSESGCLEGEWIHLDEMFYAPNGGHGMLFKTMEGNLCYTLHYPDDRYKEAPVFFDVEEKPGKLILKNNR
ncbi:MAG: family 43 glycosylhydrolase [Lachnospiraceae bacterium]|nr:family 43 glycosylhydrolase [Lachnospiraceae bacterium]